MAIRSSLLLLFYFINLVAGIILPGPCPILQHSDEQEDSLDFNWHSVVSSVPFAARKSYLFREIFVGEYPHCHSLSLFESWKFLLHYGGLFNDCQLAYSKLMGSTAGNASYFLKFDVSPESSDNCTRIQDKVHVWFVNGTGTIIWSCEEGKSGKEHDEALLLAVPSHINSDDDQFGEKVNKLRLILGLYLEKPLLESIVWPKATRRKRCRQELLKCYTENCLDVISKTNPLIIYASLLLVFGFFIIYKIGVLLCGIIRKIKRNRVAAS